MLIFIVVISAGAVGLHRSSHPTLDQRTASLANQVRCPVCDGETAQQSDSPPSLAIRSEIHAELAAGETPKAVLAGIVDAYGRGILERPPTTGVSLVVWIAPIVAVVCAVVGLLVAFRRWRPSSGGAGGGGGATANDQRLVEQALSGAAGLTPGRDPARGPGSPGGGVEQHG